VVELARPAREAAVLLKVASAKDQAAKVTAVEAAKKPPVAAPAPAPAPAPASSAPVAPAVSAPAAAPSVKP